MPDSRSRFRPLRVDEISYPPRTKDLLVYLSERYNTSLTNGLAIFLSALASVSQKKFYATLPSWGSSIAYPLNLFIMLFNNGKPAYSEIFNLLIEPVNVLFDKQSKNLFNNDYFLTDIEYKYLKKILEFSNTAYFSFIAKQASMLTYLNKNRKFLDLILDGFSYSSRRSYDPVENKIVAKSFLVTLFMSSTLSKRKWRDFVGVEGLYTRTLPFFNFDDVPIGSDAGTVEGIEYYNNKINSIFNLQVSLFCQGIGINFSESALNMFYKFVTALYDGKDMFLASLYRLLPIAPELIIKISSLLYLYESDFENNDLIVDEPCVKCAVELVISCYQAMLKMKYLNQKPIDKILYKKCLAILLSSTPPFQSPFKARDLQHKTKLDIEQLRPILNRMIQERIIKVIIPPLKVNKIGRPNGPSYEIIDSRYSIKSFTHGRGQR